MEQKTFAKTWPNHWQMSHGTRTQKNKYNHIYTTPLKFYTLIQQRLRSTSDRDHCQRLLVRVWYSKLHRYESYYDSPLGFGYELSWWNSRAAIVPHHVESQRDQLHTYDIHWKHKIGRGQQFTEFLARATSNPWIRYFGEGEVKLTSPTSLAARLCFTVASIVSDCESSKSLPHVLRTLRVGDERPART